MHTGGRKIHVESAVLHVEECGSPNGTELLFLHGGAGTLEDWSSVIGAFDDCRCVLLDTRGHGASSLGDRPLDYPLLERDAETVICEVGLTSPIVIGHSDGGITGIHLAICQTVRLSGLVTIGAHGNVPNPKIMTEIYDRLTPEKWRSRFPSTVELYEGLNEDGDFDRLLEALLAMWRNDTPGNYPGPLARSVTCPTLILGGDEDHLVPREDTLELAATIESAMLGIIPFGSHVPHWDHPERVLPYLRQFVSDMERDGSAPAN